MVYEEINNKIETHQEYSLRRQNGVATRKKLWVLTCMDERIPLKDILDISDDDAHVFRNAGGVVTDDVIRSAMLATNFLGAEEIIVINHTDCGMMLSKGTDFVDRLKEKGVDFKAIDLDPSLPELKLPEEKMAKWMKTFTNIDEACAQQVAFLRNHPLIPESTKIHGYIWDISNYRLRKPFDETL